MEENGYTVQVEDVQDLAPIKNQYNVPPQLHSCHTAIVDGYVIEGHVPVEDIERLLAERPAGPGISCVCGSRAPERRSFRGRASARHFPDPKLYRDARLDRFLRRSVGPHFCRADLDPPPHARAGGDLLSRGLVCVERCERAGHTQG